MHNQKPLTLASERAAIGRIIATATAKGTQLGNALTRPGKRPSNESAARIAITTGQRGSMCIIGDGERIGEKAASITLGMAA